MTVEELFMMPDDGYRYELVEGGTAKDGACEQRTFRNSRLHSKQSGALCNSKTGLGKMYITESRLHFGDRPRPCARARCSLVRRERTDALGRPPGYWPEAPDLAIEVISPTDRYTEVNEKVADYLAAGTRMVVVVNPRNRTVNVHTPGNTLTLTISDTLDGGDVVPGWQMPVADIFAD